MKPQPAKAAFNYFHASIEPASITISLKAITDLVRYAELHFIKAIYLLQHEQSEQITHFAITHNGTLLKQDAHGFRLIEDYLLAQKAGFEKAIDYYDAHGRGIHKYADYELVIEANIEETAILEKLKATGYQEGFAKWQRLIADESLNIPDLGTINNAYELYTASSEAGFDDYSALETALRIGFNNYDDYRAATAKGFINAAAYDDATKRGLLSQVDYEFANKHQIRDAADARAFVAMRAAAAGRQIPHDEKVLLAFLSKLEEGKRISINKICGHLTELLVTHHYPDTNELPAWFIKAIHTRTDLVKFMSSREEPKEYGSYDTDGEFFQVARLQQRHVVIDGSNVAYNSSSSKEKTPYVANMLKVVHFLESKGFEQITVITDASLRHRIPDKELLEELENTVNYIEAPAEKPADIFIIQYVKNNHCLLVSNDTFREWKVQEAWVAENLDYYRLTFLIKDDEVLMPDLENA